MASPLLSRVAASGIVGLPPVDLEIGSLTALVGERGSGKSQLLTTVAWLLGDRHAPAFEFDVGALPARGWLTIDGESTEFVRGIGGDPRRAGDESAPRLPAVNFLRATDRLQSTPSSGGEVARRLAAARNGTTDAAVAETIVDVIEACSADCVCGEVLLIEEPELQLTPQAQRYLYRLLRRFAEVGNQVLYSTRSPAFVDAAHHDEILRLDLGVDGTRIRRTRHEGLTDRELVRLAAEFDHERSEMFFARAVVLVEGQTERLSLPFVFRALGHDPDAEGIAIVEVGGKSNLPLVAGLMHQLAIPFVVVFDADRGRASAELDEAIRRSAGGAPIVCLRPDFEAATGIRTHDDKVFAAWRRFASAPAATVPPALRSIVDAAIAAGERRGDPVGVAISDRRTSR